MKPAPSVVDLPLPEYQYVPVKCLYAQAVAGQSNSTSVNGKGAGGVSVMSHHQVLPIRPVQSIASQPCSDANCVAPSNT